jgi:hypothetical protein
MIAKKLLTSLVPQAVSGEQLIAAQELFQHFKAECGATDGGQEQSDRRSRQPVRPEDYLRGPTNRPSFSRPAPGWPSVAFPFQTMR